MKRIMVAAIAIAVLGGWLVTNRTGAQQDAVNSQAAKIAKLMHQKHDALQQRYEVIKGRYQDGSVQYDHVAAAYDDVMKARLDLAASRQERLGICKQRVDNLRSLEELVESRVKTGQEPMEHKLLATASRIQAEIDCLREGT